MVTTSGLFDQAQDFAKDVGIELIDGQQLDGLISEYGMNKTISQGIMPLLDAGIQKSKPKLF